MSLSKTTSLDAIMAAMLSDLQTYAAEIQGDAMISKNPEDALLKVAEAAGSPRIVLHVDRGEAVDRDNQGPVDTVSVRIFLAQNIGPVAGESGAGIYTNTLTEDSLAMQLTRLRARVLAWRFDTALIHRGMMFYDEYAPVITPDGYPLAAYSLLFHFRAFVQRQEEAVNITIEERT